MQQRLRTLSCHSPLASALGAALVVASVLWACAPGSLRGAEPAPGTQLDAVSVWEGFEDLAGWTVDSANDPAALNRDNALVTEGRCSLRVAAEFKAKGRTLLRRAVELNLKDLHAVLADVHVPAQGAGLSFAYKDGWAKWHESPRIPLREGWNRDLIAVFDEKGFSDVELPDSGTRADAAFQVKELFLILHRGERDTETFHVDNVRLKGVPQDSWNRKPPKDLELYQPVREVERYAKFEVGVQFDGVYGNPFDPRDAAVDAVFAGPDGKERVIRGFFAGYADSPRHGPSWPIFLIRFAPPRTGHWSFVVRARNPHGEIQSKRRSFYVQDSESKGFIRVSKADPRYFECDNGEFYYPIGQNIAWSQDYEPYFARQKETGQNWVRIWLCPWHLYLEKYPGHYDLDEAARLDQILELAAAHDIRVQLVLIYHGMLMGESWRDSPYSHARGGPCYQPWEFFTDPRARGLFKRFLDYAVARWGYSTHLFAFELINEVDICEYGQFADVIAWHREMSDYLENTDPNGHLVSTSVHKNGPHEGLWNLPNMDFVQAHVYGQDVAKRVLRAHAEMSQFNKPFFVSEYGRGPTPHEAERDGQGEGLRAALWGTFMLPAAGNAMPWWWDSHIRAHGLERLFRPLSEFARGMDRRTQNYKQVERAILLDDGSEVAVRGLLNHHSCYLWLHRPATDDATPRPTLIPPGQQIALGGMLPGEYAFSILDTPTGRILQTSVLTAPEGRLVVPLVETRNDIAVKIEFKGATDPRFLPSPDLLGLEGRLPPERTPTH